MQLTLRAVDGVDVPLSRDAARLSGLLREWLATQDAPTSLPLPVHSSVLREVAKWMEHHAHDATTVARGAPESVVMEGCTARLALRVAEAATFPLDENSVHPCVALRAGDGASPLAELPEPRPLDVALECPRVVVDHRQRRPQPKQAEPTRAARPTSLLHITARWARALTPAEAEAVRRALASPALEVVYYAANVKLLRPLPSTARCDELLDPFDVATLRAFKRVGLHEDASCPTIAALLRAASHLRVGFLLHMAAAKWGEVVRGMNATELRVFHGFATEEEERRGEIEGADDAPPRALFYGAALQT